MSVIEKEKSDSWIRQNTDKSLKQFPSSYLFSQHSNKMNKTSLKNGLDFNYSEVKQKTGNENNPENISKLFFKHPEYLPFGSNYKVPNGKASIKHEILTLVGKNCITISDGEKVYALIHPELEANLVVELDFAGVEIFAAPFFNFAIGQLLKDIQPESLKHLLKVSNLKPIGNQILKLVIENSKRYYSDGDFRSRLDKVISEQANNL